VTIEAGHAGLFFTDGVHQATLGPGAHALWKNVAKACILDIDTASLLLAIAGG